MTKVQTATSTMSTTSGVPSFKKLGTEANGPTNGDQSMMTIRGGPPLSNTRTSLPQIKSKFDLEPNPFEQSFKENPSDSSSHRSSTHTLSPSLNHLLNGSLRPRRARSTSPHHLSNDSCHLSPPVLRSTPGGSYVKVSLPGIASIASPAILVQPTSAGSSKSLSPSSNSLPQNQLPAPLSPFGWGFGSLAGGSLRAGPLSPALLNGPAQTRGIASHSGLTPLIGVGTTSTGAFTPGTQALITMLSSNHATQLDTSSTTAASKTLPSHLQDPEDLSLNSSANSIGQTVHADSNLKASPTSATMSSVSRSAGPLSVSPSSIPVDPFRSLPAVVPKASTQVPSAPQQTSLSTAYAVDKKPTGLSPSAGNAGAVNNLSPTQVLVKIEPRPAVAAKPFAHVAPFPQSSNLSANSPTFSAPIPSAAQPASAAPIAIGPSGVIPRTTVSEALPSSAVPVVQPISISHPSTKVHSNDCYSQNPLYLLTAAHEASSRMSHLTRQSHHDMVDDATATAAAALTGLGSAGGSRYSSPGPPMDPGASGSQPQHAISSHAVQALAISRGASISTASTTPSLSSQPVNLSHGSSLALGAASMIRGGANGSSATSALSHQSSSHEDPTRFTAPPPTINTTTSASMTNPIHSIRPVSATEIPDQRLPSIPYAATSNRARGKKRKEGEGELANVHGNPADDLHNRRAADTVPQSNGEDLYNMPGIRSNADKTTKATVNSKSKKGKKAKVDDESEDDFEGAESWRLDEETEYHSGDRTHLTDQFVNQQLGQSQSNPNGKPETEEEKRKNFLERNRQAALKCRQRKKAWLANLQTKVEHLTNENETLQMTISQLREEIDSFRSILVSHKDCPISVGSGSGTRMTIGELVRREPGMSNNAAAMIVQQQQNERLSSLHHHHHHHPPGAVQPSVAHYSHGVTPAYRY